MFNVSIVTFNTDYKEVNNVISKCMYSKNVNVIYIIDNSPNTDLKLKLIQSKNVEYFSNPSNPGYGAAHNLAIRLSLKNNIDFHLVINADTDFPNDLVDNMHEYAYGLKDVGLVAPKLLNEDLTIQYSRKLLPTPLNMFGRAFLPKQWRKNLDKTYQLENVDKNINIDVPYVSGAFMFFRCEALKKIGLFDERFFMYPEDIDISRRFYSKSRVLYVPKFEIMHKYGGATRKSLKMFLIHIINMIRYFNKWGWFFDYERRSFNNKTLKQANLGMEEL